MIIGIVGFMGSGKDTVADMLRPLGFERDSFAKPLKDAVSVIFGWDRKKLEGVTKEDRAWREVPDDYWSTKMGKPFSPRLALQLMGTEAGRNVFHHNVWTDALERRVTADPTKHWVITDVRFNNEIDMISRIGGLVARIKRGPEPAHFHAAMNHNFDRMISKNPNLPIADRDAAVRTVHQSEWDWIGNPGIVYLLDNNGTLEDLKDNITKMVDSYTKV